MMNGFIEYIVNLPTKMGNAASTFNSQKGEIKTLVLGCMGSGKTTFMRQMFKNYPPKNYNKYRRLEYYRYSVQLNLLQVYRELKNVCIKLEINYTKFAEDFEVIDVYRHREIFPTHVCEAITRLRDSGLFESCRLKQRILPLPQNYNYFIRKANNFMTADYMPTETDVMMSYAQSCGYHRETITWSSMKFDMLEMPGHHIWRRKWSLEFPETMVVIFVVDLSELCDPAFYDKGHLENKTVSVFSELVNHELLQDVYWMLIFNKVDTFNDHAAGFDFKKLASHLDTADSARTFYRSQFTTLVPKNKCYAHMVSLVNNKESQTLLSDMFKRVQRYHKDRAVLT